MPTLVRILLVAATVVASVLVQAGCSSSVPLLQQRQEDERDTPACAYTLRFDPSQAPPRFEIELHAIGLPREGTYIFRLENWGGWDQLPGEYLHVSHTVPDATEVDSGSLRFIPGPGWDGSLDVTYAIPLETIGSEHQRAHSILPAADTTYATAATANTIARLFCNGEPLTIPATLTVHAPEGWTVFTGWDGAATPMQPIALPDVAGNSIYAIGQPVAVRTTEADGIRCEVFQFAAGDAAADKVLDITRAFVERASREFGHRPDEPIRVCISGATGGGYLTDHGLVVGFPPGSPDWLLDSPYYRHLVCHELFHTWLGKMLKETDGERTVWFKEGFTEYMSLRIAAAAGIVPREWFSTRLLELEQGARDSAFGSVAFNDPSVTWRDGNGPFETMAYKGGAVLAFALDAELRHTGRDGLAEMLRLMLTTGQGRYSAGSIRDAVRSLGLADFESRHISGTATPSVRDVLLAAGYAETKQPTNLAYLGLRIEPDARLGRITEIDPDSPAAAAGFRVGDSIGGYAPARQDIPSVGGEISTRFTFGLTELEPDSGPVSVWVHRDEPPDAIELRVTPRPLPGGEIREIKSTSEAEQLLFGTPPLRHPATNNEADG